MSSSHSNTSGPVEILEVRNGYGLRLGWAHLLHEAVPKGSTLIELFVWPIFRRQGLATLMESWAGDRARSWGSPLLKLQHHEADSQVGLRQAGRLFALARGYS